MSSDPSNLLECLKYLPTPPRPDPLPAGTPWWGVALVRVGTYLAWAVALAIVLWAAGWAAGHALAFALATGAG